MKIVIDVPEEIYEHLLTRYKYQNIDDIGLSELDKVGVSVKNGMPLHPNGDWTKRHCINGDKTLDMWVCSHCGEEFSYDAETGASIYDYDYCPNCGDYKRNRAEGGIERMKREEEYRQVALDLLEMYVEAEQSVVGEFSGNFYESRIRLEREIKKQLKKLNAEDMFEYFTRDKWLFEVEE